MSLLVALAALWPCAAWAQMPPADPRPTREIMVPFEDLNILLEGQPQRVLLSRKEYDELLAKARQAPAKPDRQPPAVVSAEYAITVGEDRAEISGTLTLDVLDDVLQPIGLDLGGVGLRSAKLDDDAAPIGVAADGRPMVFVDRAGRRTLRLEMVTPVQTTAALQILNFQLPAPSAARLRATVPGNVEVKSGAAVIRREYDDAARLTRFELLPSRGATTLVMTLNNRQRRTERVVVARSVLVDEVTAAYERLHATISFAVLHQAVDSFRLAVPAGFEVSTVVSPAVSSWATEQEGDRQILNVKLREATSETVVLTLSASRVPPKLENWTLPRFEPLDVAGHVSVVGLLVEDRMQAESLTPTGLIPIDNNTLVQALPASVFQADPGAPRVRPVAAYYAPQGEFSLGAAFRLPPSKLRVTSNLLLLLEDAGQQVRGGFALLPEAESVYGFEFTAPAGWTVASVSGFDGSAIPFEAFAEMAGGWRIRVRLPRPIAAGQETSVFFHATSTPEGWLGDWRSRRDSFPVFAVSGAARDVGAAAVAVGDDLTVRPGELQGLTSLDENEKKKLGLQAAATLAYRYDAHPYSAQLEIERTVPRITARTYAFFRVLPDALDADSELVYDVQDARTRQLQFRLPASTPAAIDVQALDGVVLKEFSGAETDEDRLWTVTLAEARRGRVRLRVKFQQRLTDDELRALTLPAVAAAEVAYQSGYVSVEGHADLDVEVSSHPRKADIGELADADYQPGRRLIGAFAFVGEPVATVVKAARRDGFGLPAAIVQRAELVTALSDHGVSQSVARFLLRTKTPFLEFKLPRNSTLWSVDLDQAPIKPQRHGDSLLVSLPTTGAATIHDLRIIYETPVRAAEFRGQIGLFAPQLLLRAAQDSTGREVPLADLAWDVYLPNGFHAVSADGTVVTQDLRPGRLAVTNLLHWLYDKSGGVGRGYGLLGRVQEARELSRSYNSAPGTGRMDAPAGAVHGPAPMSEPSSAMPNDPFTEESTRSMRDRFEMDKKEIEQGALEAQAADEALMPPKPDMDGDGVPKEEKPAIGPEDKAQFGEWAGNGKPGKDDKAKDKRHWAMEGIRSLMIHIQPAGLHVSFESLGVDPRVELTLADDRRLHSLAWGLALVIGLIGLAGTSKPVRWKSRYVIGIGLLSTLLPLLAGGNALLTLCNAAFYAAAAVAAYYLAIGACRWCCGACCGRLCLRKPTPNITPAAIVALLLVVSAAASVRAQPAVDPAARPVVVQIVPPPAPVVVPEDAIIVPYDPDQKVAIGAPEQPRQVLIPYQQFVELWRRAHPEETPDKEPPAAPYALAGGAYRATLSGDDYLLIEGQMELNIYADGYVAVPLPLTGGVLAKADVDGRPARLGVMQGAAPAAPPAAEQQAANPAPQPPPGQALLVLYAQGKGRHTIDLAVRIKLERRGGWRVATGRVPAAPASALSLRVAEAGTEVRLAGVRDRTNYETLAPDEMIETALADSEALSVQWRPKVSEGMVERGLTVQSTAQATVQEDGVRLVWRLHLEFRRAQRDGFTLLAPAGYLIERVTGQNIRGWEAKAEENGQRLEVTLLKAARDEENFTVYLWRSGAAGMGEMTQLDVPQIAVEGAQLHAGQVTIHRSPLLELRTVETTGVSRTDLPPEAANGPAADPAATGLEESPLGNRPFAAYRFAAVPFTLKLAVEPTPSKVSAEWQTLLRIAERQRSLESRLLIRVEGRPLHQARIAVPADLEIDQVVAPGLQQWGATQEEDRRIVTVLLSAGQVGEIAVVIRGTLGDIGPVETVPLPRLELLDAARQEGHIVVQPDPAFAAQTAELQNCEPVLLARVEGWLSAEQRRLAQLTLFFRTADYAGQIKLAPRKPVVVCNTFTNVRVTSRTIEETVLLDFRIREAGIREVSFLLPAWMKQARVQAPLVRQKTIAPTGEGADAPLRVRLQLQDEVIGQYRVLVENDRLLTADEQDAPIPVVETGRAERRFVAFESAGRGEVVVVRQEGLTPLGRQQQEWRTAAEVLGEKLTQAYLVEPDAAAPRLTFRSQDRQSVETVGAKIGLAQCVLVIDAQGAYRAAQTYRLSNSTEQFLELVLPEGAEMWTARVDGEAVKPSEAPGSFGHRVRVPLFKTAVGDIDYELVVKYGGKLPSPGGLTTIRFPLIRTVNINVELSQVRLFVPPSFRWFDFGGTMRLVQSEADLAAGWLSYQNKQLQEQLAVTRGNDPLAKVRAINNLKQLAVQSEMLQRQSGVQLRTNSEYDQAYGANVAIVQEANEQVMIVDQQPEVTDGLSNSTRLNEFYKSQSVTRSRNVVNQADNNFDDSQTLSNSGDADPSQPGGQPKQSGKAEFNARWLEGNKLGKTQQAPAKGPASRVVIVDDSRSTKPSSGDAKPNAPAQPMVPRYAQQDVQEGLESKQKMGELSTPQSQQGQTDNDTEQQVFNYRRKVAQGGRQNANAPGQPMGSGQTGGMGGGGMGGAPPQANQPLDAFNADAPVTGNTDGWAAYGNAPVTVPEGLASLDVDIPQRGVEYRFTTPRGDVEITARAASQEFTGRIIRLSGLLVAIVVGWFLWKHLCGPLAAACASRHGSTLLILLGLLSALTGVLPLAGVTLILLGIGLKIRRRLAMVPALA